LLAVAVGAHADHQRAVGVAVFDRVGDKVLKQTHQLDIVALEHR